MHRILCQKWSKISSGTHILSVCLIMCGCRGQSNVYQKRYSVLEQLLENYRIPNYGMAIHTIQFNNKGNSQTVNSYGQKSISLTSATLLTIHDQLNLGILMHIKMLVFSLTTFFLMLTRSHLKPSSRKM